MTCEKVGNITRCTKGTVTLTSLFDAQNPLISHNWLIDGTPAGTSSQISRDFNSTGMHTVQHSGSNACGGQCLQTEQLEIVDAISPPTTSSPATPSAGLVVGAVLVAAILGAVLLSSRK